MTESTIGVVGAGIVGLAVARELARRRPGTRVIVLEKEDRVAAHQTSHNSGVVHAGVYYRPGSLKAELCTRGRAALREYCQEHRLPFEECGKIVVAVDRDEMSRFEALERTARANGVPGLRRLTAPQISELEPHAAGLAALHSPSTAITDFTAVARCLAEEVRAAGGEVLLSTRVRSIARASGGVKVDVYRPDGPVRISVDHLVLCAGLQADRMGALAGHAASPRIVPFRGEYMRVKPDKRGLVSGMIYPVPDPRYPFLGVHFTRRVDGELEVGPNAVLALSREGYRRRDFSGVDLSAVLTWPGTWRMARRHWRTGIAELRGSLSTRAYMRGASRYVPEIGPSDVVRAGAGVRAQALDRQGRLLDDFLVDQADGVTSVRNAPSPAATSSLTIAEHVVDRLERHL